MDHSSSRNNNNSEDEDNNKSTRIRVLVNLLNVSKEVQDDTDGQKLLYIVNHPNKGNRLFSNVASAKSYLLHKNKGPGSSSDNNIEDDDRLLSQIQKQITRYYQIKDKYTSLSSILLKSQAFHLTYNTNTKSSSSSEQHQQDYHHCVIDLPRTQHKKPYIPVLDYDDCGNNSSLAKNSATTIKKEEDVYPISVSHQFPFVGIARMLPSRPLNADDNNNYHEIQTTIRPTNLLVGMDIVTFDPPNPKLYDTIDDFIRVFQNSFTEWEWSMINDDADNSNDEKLHEFYIRWSMKEAYTKALGLGMGIDFQSFESRLLKSNDDSSLSSISNLWKHITTTTCTNTATEWNNNKDYKGCYLSGSICHNKSSDDKPDECWDFFFYPICDYDDADDTIAASAAKGCMCICAGPFNKTLKSSSSDDDDPKPSFAPSSDDPRRRRFQADIEWTSLQALMDWHYPS